MGKAQSSLRTVEPFAAFFGALGIVQCTCYHLTQQTGLVSLNRSTGSMPLYGHTAGTMVEGGFNSQRSRITLPILALINLCLEFNP